jgi:hypothetical protein
MLVAALPAFLVTLLMIIWNSRAKMGPLNKLAASHRRAVSATELTDVADVKTCCKERAAFAFKTRPS